MDIKARVAALKKRHKTYRAASAATGISLAYLFKLGTGEKANPTADTMRKLGLIKGGV